MTDTEYWDAPRVMLNMNVAALQRDVLKGRRDQIRWDRTLLMERSGELLEIRKRIQIIDNNKWMGTRWKEGVDLKSRPLIASDEWRKLIVNGHITEDWEQWNEKEPNDQWQVLENAGMITLRLAPGVAEGGNTSDDGGLGREGFFAGSAARESMANPVFPPLANARPKCRLALCL